MVTPGYGDLITLLVGIVLEIQTMGIFPLLL